MNHRQQKRRVGTGSNEQMLARQFGSLGAARIDDDQLATAALQILQSLTHIGHRPDTAIGRQGIGTQHQKVVGAVHIGDRVQKHVSETPQRHQVMRQLVYRRRREAIARTDVSKQVPLVRQHAVIVDRGITKVGADGIDTPLFDGRGQRIRGEIQRL